MLAQKFLLAGTWTETQETYPVVNPWNQTEIATVCMPSFEQVQKAVELTTESFQITKNLSLLERNKILLKMADLITQQKSELAKIISEEAGKPISLALKEVDRAIVTLRLSAEESLKLTEQIIEIDSSKTGKIKRFPIGSIIGISPFNFPLNLVCHKLGPAIAAGCPIILKPAERTPLSSFKLAEIALESGWPKQAISVLPIDRSDKQSLDFLIQDERIKVLSFTGSASVGWNLKNNAGKKRVLLELGGNAAVIVHDDANLELAAKKLAPAMYAYAGQSCISSQRIFVQKKVYEKFKVLLIQEIQKLKIGNPADPEVMVGPMIDLSSAERVEQWLQEAVQEGAKILLGGKREKNLFYPTLLANVNPKSKCYSEEIFAPVKVLVSYDSFKQALNLVNDSKYGLQAGIFTQDSNKALQAFEELDVGGVLINETPTFRADNQPYGGIKDSGFGREGPKYAIEEFTELKVLITELKQ
ncbi:MAG: aldehyde dehydrogenase family protein [Candidatus Diapherotrites archaeon]|nr:aldehyde dehydrogenase family protein [Candidatus Diapherotrites archaeon]